MAEIIQREATNEEAGSPTTGSVILSSPPAVADVERVAAPAPPVVGTDRAPGLPGRIWQIWRAGTDAMLRPFIVPSSSGHNLAFLDSLRGVAVLLVVVYHCWVFSGEPSLRLTIPGTGGALDLTPILFNGSAGVQLFFVLSAFLLSQPWLRADYRGQPRPSLRRYLRHRFFRIVPAYYCCLFLMLLLLVPAFIPITAVYSRDGVRALGIHLLFMQYLFPFTASSYGVNGSLWTLTIEMMLYLLLPWAVVLFLRNRWLLIMPVLLAVNLLWLRVWAGFSAPALAVIRYEQHFLPGASDANVRYFLARQFPCHLVTFGLGIVLANLFVRHQLALGKGRVWRIGTHPWAGAAYFVAGWIFLFWGMRKVEYDTTLRYGWYLREILFSVGFTLILGGLLFAGTRLRACCSPALLRLVGLVGYSAYLWHLPIVTLFSHFSDVTALHPAQRFPLTLGRVSVAVLLMSIFFFLAVERPFLLIGRRRSHTPAG